MGQLQVHKLGTDVLALHCGSLGSSRLSGVSPAHTLGKDVDSLYCGTSGSSTILGRLGELGRVFLLIFVWLVLEVLLEPLVLLVLA